jgi:hypothetical protein
LTTNSSVSAVVDTLFLSDIDFLDCTGVLTSSAPVSPVAVPAVNCASVAISTLPATVSLALAVVPVANDAHAPQMY